MLKLLLVLSVVIKSGFAAAIIEDSSDKKLLKDITELSNEIVHHATSDEVLKFIMELSTHYKTTGELKDVKLEHWETWEAPFNMSREVPYYLAGYDEENRPLWVGEFGHWDLRRMVESGNETFEAFDQYVHQAVYRLYRSFVEKSTEQDPVASFNVILDFDGFSLRQIAHVPTMAYILSLFARFHTVLDRHLDNAFFINVNFVAERFVQVIRPIIGGLAERLDVYGSQKIKWIPALLRKFPSDQLPDWYGGNKGFAPVKVYG